MDIFLSINNREEVIRLPVIPSKFKIKSPVTTKTVDTVNQGEIKLIGLKKLKSIGWESFFPNTDYTFCKDSKYKEWDYVNILEKWRDRRVPIRIIITKNSDSESIINMPVVIDNFEYGIKDGSQDVYYSIDLTEFKFIELKREGVKNA